MKTQVVIYFSNLISVLTIRIIFTQQNPNGKELCNLLVRVYQKAFDSIFENMPVATPFKDTLAPVKDATKMYVDALTKMSDAWTQSVGKANRV